MITICLWQAVCVFAALALGYILYRVYRYFNKKSSKHKLAAFDVASMLSQHGLVRLPLILRYFASGDIVDAANEIRKIVEAIEAGVDVMSQEFDKVFDRVLDSTLSTPNGIVLVKAKVDAAIAKQTGSAGTTTTITQTSAPAVAG